MAAAEEPRQFWIRNDKGTTWGPLTFATIEVLLDNTALSGSLQASRDGVRFVTPGRLPELRDAFPKDLWGDTNDPLPEEVRVRQPPRVGAPGRPPPTIGKPPSADDLKPQPARSPTSDELKAQARPAAAEPSRPGPTPDPPGPASSDSPKRVAPAAPGEGVPESGSLDDTPPFRLYYLAATANQTGMLTLTGPSAGYQVYFKKGAPEAVRPTREDEDFGAFLVTKGVLREEQLAQARQAAGGGEVLNALFGMQLIGPGDAFRYIGEHAAGALTKAFTVDRGTFTFDPTANPPATAMPLGDRWKLICDMVRAVPVPDLKARLGPRLDAPIMKSGGRVETSQLKLTPQEARAASYFDGVRSLNQLCEALPNETDPIVRTAFLLYRFEALSFGDVAAAPPPPKAAAPPKPAPPPKPQHVEPPGVPKQAPAPPRPSQASQAAINPGTPPVLGGQVKPGVKPAPPRPPPPKPPPRVAGPAKAVAPPVAPPTDPGNDPTALKAYWEQMKGKNHFHVFGLTEEATSGEVKKTYFQLAKRFHPDGVPTDAPPEVGKLKAEIFARINEAQGVLSDDARREAYIEELKANAKKQVADKFASSEESFQMGCIMVKSRKFPEALEVLDEAIAEWDREGEYYVWRAWARFMIAPDKKAARAKAFEEIDKGMAMNPHCSQGPFFKGQISKVLGDMTSAQRYFRDTLEIDSNHLEAQREVRQR